VLATMGLAPQLASAAIRISLGHDSTEHDTARFLEAWTHITAKRRARKVA